MGSEMVVTLIHGTFARGATWLGPTSSLCQALADAFGVDLGMTCRG
jgi:hypothetical protein